MEKQVAIIGSGVSGLLACKYSLQKGFKPIVFEADSNLGGVWRHTIDSTRLQNPKSGYEFSDFPWPSSVTDLYPSHAQVLEYLESYAQTFSIYPCIKFNSKVISIDYVGESLEEIESWHLWGGTGRPFDSKGIWHIKVENIKTGAVEDYSADFVILCLGQFSGLPNIPEFPPNHGPEVFNGKVMHIMDYGNLDSSSATNLVKGKRVTVIGSQKYGKDLAAHCANINGPQYPCTIIQRSAHWFYPDDYLSLFLVGLQCYNRFSELLIHKPGESFLLGFLATLLSPLGWIISKLFEWYLRLRLPMKKYGVVPSTSFKDDFFSCKLGVLPHKYYERVEDGSIIIKKSQSVRFSREGLIVEGENRPIQTDVVIYATGFLGDQKVKNIFQSPVFQNYMMGSPSSCLALYRQLIHPRIPRLAVIGFSDTISNLFASEVKCRWLAHLLEGNIKLPNIQEMEKEIEVWEKYVKKHAGQYFRTNCIAKVQVWYNNQLCREMGCNPIRKKGILKDLFEAHKPSDYAGL